MKAQKSSDGGRKSLELGLIVFDMKVIQAGGLSLVIALELPGQDLGGGLDQVKIGGKGPTPVLVVRRRVVPNHQHVKLPIGRMVEPILHMIDTQKTQQTRVQFHALHDGEGLRLNTSAKRLGVLQKTFGKIICQTLGLGKHTQGQQKPLNVNGKMGMHEGLSKEMGPLKRLQAAKRQGVVDRAVDVVEQDPFLRRENGLLPVAQLQDDLEGDLSRGKSPK